MVHLDTFMNHGGSERVNYGFGTARKAIATHTAKLCNTVKGRNTRSNLFLTLSCLDGQMDYTFGSRGHS